MNVSVIIPTKDRSSILEETLQHIYQIPDFREKPNEVIVINDGKLQLDYLLQKYKNLQIHRNKSKGAAGARNTGAALAKNDLLLFLDDDMLMSNDCLARHTDLHIKYPHSLVSGSWEYTATMVEVLQKSPFGRYKLLNDYRAITGTEENKLSDGIYAATSLASFNLSIMHTDFEELKGFNDSFPYAGCEDQEFTMRAKEKGYTLVLDTSNICINNEKDRADMNKWLTRQYTGVQGYPLLCELFPYRKSEALFVENTPINTNDSFALKVKKGFKYILSFSPLLALLKGTTSLLSSLNFSDKLLARLYKTLCGLYLYKGFRTSYNALQNKKHG